MYQYQYAPIKYAVDKSNFCFFIRTIKQLTTENMSYKLKSLCIIEKSQNKLEKVQGIIGNLVGENLHVFGKNHGLKVKIIRIIGLNLTESLDIKLTSLIVINKKVPIVPITSVNVEHLFRKYKNIL